MMIKVNDKQLSVDQLTVAKVVASRLGIDVNLVMNIIEMEQKTTMSYVRRGYRVTKKNFLTLEPRFKKAYKLESALDNKIYDIPDRQTVSVRVGSGFKSYVANSKNMPEKLCRFVKSDN